ncbi:hypothetical protein V1264_005881 [Littorina saxatilis]|uniref:Uncharacterized protein n=1 Tax=Littorina saxatilis TaxID=31220 RepID=A0AAN9G7G2_9CAEN
MQAAHPRILIAPLQIGLGVQMHHCFGSKFLIDTVYSLGFSSSYREVKTYEMSAAATQEIIVPATDEHFMQYMADNVDHNTGTIDGLNTFHGMGMMIASITPFIKNRSSIARKTEVRLEEVMKKARVKISFYDEVCEALASITYEKLSTVLVEDPTKEVEVLWKSAWLLRPQRPFWSGVMQAVHNGDFPGQSSIVFLPMFDLKPSDKTCVYSTLLFHSAEARRYNKTHVVTFDQPLGWKALSIISAEAASSELRSVVLRLGTFHVEMIFLACIGHLMAETGLYDALCTVYAPNAAKAMLEGKAVTRAIRGHFLIDAALNALLASKALRVPLPSLPTTAVDRNSEECPNAPPEPVAAFQPLHEVSTTEDTIIHSLLPENDAELVSVSTEEVLS